MNSIVALPIAAVPVASPAMSSAPPDTDRRALEAYASWLFMERRILCSELWPHMGADAESWDWHDNAGSGWHFRFDGDWKNLPQPSTRAAAVLDLVGVDWRVEKRDLGLNHDDTGQRPELPVGWPADPDARLIDIEAKIFQHKAAVDALKPEIIRLSNIWQDEFVRLADECDVGRSQLTSKERWAIVEEMPESKEHARLSKLTEPHYEAADRLVKKMWAMRARTPEGRAAKVRVLLGWLMGDDWRENDNDADYPIKEARELMFEFVGGEPAAQLRDQFAA